MPRYHPALVVLHWLLAFLIISELLFGWQALSKTPNSDPLKVSLLLPHMAFGVGILALMLIRLLVRLFTKHPPEAETGIPAFKRVGGLTHWVIYAVVIGSRCRVFYSGWPQVCPISCLPDRAIRCLRISRPLRRGRCLERWLLC